MNARLRPQLSRRAWTFGALTMVMLGFGGIIVIEAAVMHLLVQRWSVVGAWLLTALSAYSVVLVARRLSRHDIAVGAARG